MSARATELVMGPLRQTRRSMVGWAIGLGALIAVTVAFWPVFRGSSGISEAIEQLPGGIVEAFGLADFGTPAGFLRGNLYDVIVPLLLAIGTVAVANGLTAAEEDAGRLEMILAQPVSRRGVFIGRSLAVTAWVAVLSLVILLVQLASDALFELGIDLDRVIATVVLCGMLALLAGAVGLAVAGRIARGSVVLAVGVTFTIVSYVVSALLPLSEALEPLSRLSPWDWALGGDPLVNPTEPWRYLALLIPAAILVIVGVIGFERRDVRAA